MKNEDSENVKKIVLLDVIPLSLGIETLGDIMSVVIPRNTTIPCERTKDFTTPFDNQTSVCFRVLEGEGFHAKECNLLDNFDINNIPKGPAGTPKLVCTFKYDANGILKVSAFEKTTGNNGLVVIK